MRANRFQARTSTLGLLGRIVSAVLAGGLTYGAVITLLGRRHAARLRA